MRKILLFFVIALLFFPSCDKTEGDIEVPDIMVDSPLFNSYYSVGDTLFIRGVVKDDTWLKSIKIAVYDRGKNIEIITAVNIIDNGNRYIINNIIILNDPGMESGLYYLGITADDGDNVKRYFVPIHIVGFVPKKLGVIYLSSIDNGSTYVQMIDSMGVETTLLILDGDYQTSEILPKYGILFVAGAITGDFNAVELDGKSVSWKIANQSNNRLPWFFHLYIHNSVIYIATQNESISSYSVNGLLLRRYLCTQGWIPKLILEYENRLFGMTERNGYQNPQMSQFYIGSGLLINQHVMNFRPVKMFGKEDEYLLLFGNDGTKGKIYRYYFLKNAVNDITDFGTDTIIDVAQISITEYLVLTNRGVWSFSDGHNSFPNFFSIPSNGKSLIYDAFGNQFSVVGDHRIMVFQLPGGILKATINTQKEIRKAHIYYDR